MITLDEENRIAQLLSELSPMDYWRLLEKVDRSKWELVGPKEYIPRDGASEYIKTKAANATKPRKK